LLRTALPPSACAEPRSLLRPWATSRAVAENRLTGRSQGSGLERATCSRDGGCVLALGSPPHRRRQVSSLTGSPRRDRCLSRLAQREPSVEGALARLSARAEYAAPRRC